jgi:hypothetical protein
MNSLLPILRRHLKLNSILSHHHGSAYDLILDDHHGRGILLDHWVAYHRITSIVGSQ